MSPAYGYDEDGQREHDACDVCGSGSCPGSGSGGDDACTYRCPTCRQSPCRRWRALSAVCPGPVPAPPLTPVEQAVVEAFETAPDPFAGEDI